MSLCSEKCAKVWSHIGTPKNEPHARTSHTHFRMLFARTRTLATAYRMCACTHAPSQPMPCKYGASSSYSTSLILNEPWVRYEDEKREFGEGPLNFNQSRLPFKMSLESLKQFEFSQAGFKYSFVGMRMTLTRNSFGLLIGGYYGPTIMFSLLSLLSFSISPDIVSLKLGSGIVSATDYAQFLDFSLYHISVSKYCHIDLTLH